MTYSSTASSYIGNLRYAGFHHIFTNSFSSNISAPSQNHVRSSNDNLGVDSFGPSSILGQVASMPGAMYCCVTASLLIGTIGDRGRTVPALVFLFIWATIVYDPIACWTWNANGWAAKLGYLDYAGGTPVHISAGCAALAYSWVMGKRIGLKVSQEKARDESETGDSSGIRRFKSKLKSRRLKNAKNTPSNSTNLELNNLEFEANAIMSLNASSHSGLLVVLGTGLLWVGWIGFNAGASVIPTLRTMLAVLNTHVSAACGGLTWMILDYRLRRYWSVIGLCSGIVSGLVCITPAAGFVPTWSAPIFGILGAFCANAGTKIKYMLHIDDSLDVFAVHAVGGIVGNMLTALFASKSVAALDGITVISGGWIDHHYVQLWFQIAGTLAASAYAFGVSAAILAIINVIPGLKLRIDPHDEVTDGIDAAEHDEFAYDYVELIPNLPDSIDDMHVPFQKSVSYRNDSTFDYSFNNHDHSDPVAQDYHRNSDNIYLGTNPLAAYSESLPQNPSEKFRLGSAYNNLRSNNQAFRRDSRVSTNTNLNTPGLLDETDTVNIQDITEVDPDDPLSAVNHSRAIHNDDILSNMVQTPNLASQMLGGKTENMHQSNTSTDATNIQQPTTFRARRNMIRSYSDDNGNSDPNSLGIADNTVNEKKMPSRINSKFSANNEFHTPNDLENTSISRNGISIIANTNDNSTANNTNLETRHYNRFNRHALDSDSDMLDTRKTSHQEHSGMGNSHTLYFESESNQVSVPTKLSSDSVRQSSNLRNNIKSLLDGDSSIYESE